MYNKECNRLTLLVVLYKQSIISSTTIKSFCENCTKYHENVKLIIWDNSPNEIENDFEILRKNNISYEYKHTPENTSLAVIYNYAIRNANTGDILLLFDQDSVIDNHYIDTVTEAVKNNANIALFIPYIRYKDKYMSPGKFFIYKGKYISKLNLGVIESKNVLAITSGMAVRPSLLKKYNLFFDENLKLYGIDSKFCLDYSKVFKYMYVMDYNLKHSLSQFEKEKKEIKTMRLKSQMKAIRYITKKESFFAYIICLFATSFHLLINKIR